MIDYVACNGREWRLNECSSRLATSSCDSSRQAGVRCRIPAGKHVMCMHVEDSEMYTLAKASHPGSLTMSTAEPLMKCS